MNVIFVRYANLNRSPRAAEVCERLLRERGAGQFRVMSAGTDPPESITLEQSIRRYGSDLPTTLTKEMVQSADVVVALDEKVAATLERRFGLTSSQVICLDIPDLYSLEEGNLRELYALLEQKLIPIAESWAG